MHFQVDRLHRYYTMSCPEGRYALVLSCIYLHCLLYSLLLTYPLFLFLIMCCVFHSAVICHFSEAMHFHEAVAKHMIESKEHDKDLKYAR